MLVFGLPGLAWGDGMVRPAVAFPAAVTIPDQQALIYYTNGTERLVVETRFMGAGTNFAWVVPLPSQPVVEAATTGLFPTLQYLFAPEIKNDALAFAARAVRGKWRTGTETGNFNREIGETREKRDRHLKRG